MAKANANMTNDEMQQEILRVQMETAQIGLEKAKFDNEAWKNAQQDSRRRMQMREGDYQAQRQGQKDATVGCRHRSGGFSADSPKKGRAEPCISNHKMPFGEQRLACLRCGLEVLEPNPRMEHEKGYRDTWDRTWNEQNALFTRMLELWEECGLAQSAGPQFTAQTLDGIPLRPAMR
jgi:hypothetical protein